MLAGDRAHESDSCCSVQFGSESLMILRHVSSWLVWSVGISKTINSSDNFRAPEAWPATKKMTCYALDSFCCGLEIFYFIFCSKWVGDYKALKLNVGLGSVWLLNNNNNNSLDSKFMAEWGCSPMPVPLYLCVYFWTTEWVSNWAKREISFKSTSTVPSGPQS